jgi:Holliday junction resolvasome RuvABC endonuclease subunit
MGIDPSTTNMGVFVVDVNIEKSEKFKLVYANTIYGEKVLYDIPVQFDDLAGTKLLARTYGLYRSLKTLVEIHQPDTGICEDNFMGMSPLTFKQLIQCVALLRQSFTENDVHLSYVLPNQAKEIVKANFRGTTKEDVQKGLKEYGGLEAGDFDISLMDEHTTDAGAIALYRCEQIAKDYGVYQQWPLSILSEADQAKHRALDLSHHLNQKKK